MQGCMASRQENSQENGKRKSVLNREKNRFSFSRFPDCLGDKDLMGLKLGAEGESGGVCGPMPLGLGSGEGLRLSEERDRLRLPGGGDGWGWGCGGVGVRALAAGGGMAVVSIASVKSPSLSNGTSSALA